MTNLKKLANFFKMRYPGRSSFKVTRNPAKVLRVLARIINPSDYCLICDLELHPKNSEKVAVYFNVRSCKGLTKVLGHDLRSSESQRICRQCKHKIDSSLKKV